MVLLTLAFIFLVLDCSFYLAGRGAYTQPVHRILGACVLLATSIVMFVTVRHWVKWFIGILGYAILKFAISLILGFTPSVPSIIRPRLIFFEYLVSLVIVAALWMRYMTHVPNKLETAGIVGMPVALSFSIVWDLSLPIFVGAAVLGMTQLASGSGTFRLRRLLWGQKSN